ncbi:MAG: TonB-dependent receptor [Acidobacteria bacterium]|nr:TonB-dependent receptor [Acidobacteriota bacterium]
MRFAFKTALWAAVLAGFQLAAQEYRATLLGVVTDPSGASIPAAGVTITNLDTGVGSKSQTNADGNYVVPFLIPGRYALRVEVAGFKTFERSPIELRTNDRTRADVTLEVGQLSDRVTVTAEAALLEVSSSDRGQVLDNVKITELPLNGRNPWYFTNLSPGVRFTGGMTYMRPFGEGTRYVINGGRTSTNEFQLDGISNNIAGPDYNGAYTPPVEATQEMKIMTSTYDAQYGHTGGGVISLTVKPGTKNFHGVVYEYLRRTALEANQYANNANGKPRANHFVDQYGFEIDGPVTIPKLYRGKDRTFFMFSMERYREAQPQPSQGMVPTAEERKGDFTKTFNSAGRMYTVHDPLTIRPNPSFNPAAAVTLNNLQYLRTPFAGNLVPQNRTEPIALRVLQDVPLPNQAGDPVTHANNWFGANVAEATDFQNFIARADHNLNSVWKMYARWSYNYRDGGRIDYYDWNTPAAQKVHAGRRNDTAVFDTVGTLSPSTILSVRLGFNRFVSLSKFKPQDVTGLGFPKTFASQLQMPDKYPIFQWENYITASMSEWNIAPSDTYTAQATMTKIAGTHSMKFGGEVRKMHYASVGRGNASGTFGFTRSWTSSNPQVTDPAAGNAIASFLLGYMSSASANRNAAPYQSWNYPVLFFQDDWQLTRRLTLNLGLRWDYESPMVERYNRQNVGFDLSAQSPYQAPGYNLRGGLLFAGDKGQPRGAFNPDRNNWQPRLGVAYRMLGGHPLVFRGGVARTFLPVGNDGGVQGFSQTTNALTSTSDFRPFNVLSNPFPDGLIQPLGAAGGLATQVGDGVSFSDRGRVIPRLWQYSAGFQYELVPGLLVDASYVGSRTGSLQVSRSLSYLTLEQLALGTAYLSASVPNPFYGVLPSKTSRGGQATIQRRNLMLQYPHYTGVTMNNTSLGRSWYNAFQMKVEKRMSRGLTLVAAYTNSKTMEMMSFRNAQDTGLARELTSTDVPQRLTVAGVYQFPIGPNKRFLNSGLASHIVGGWELNWSTLLQSGTPIALPNYQIAGDPKLLSGQALNRWFNTSPEMWIQRPPDTLRITPARSPNIRRHTAPQLDLTLIRNFRIREGHKFQFKLSAFNATNTPIFNDPNTTPTSPLFGVVPITQMNLPRSVEIGLRYSF